MQPLELSVKERARQYVDHVIQHDSDPVDRSWASDPSRSRIQNGISPRPPTIQWRRPTSDPFESDDQPFRV